MPLGRVWSNIFNQYVPHFDWILDVVVHDIGTGRVHRSSILRTIAKLHDLRKICEPLHVGLELLQTK